MIIKNKTGIAIITLLLLPVFFLFFLKSCGDNRYSLERLHCDNSESCYSISMDSLQFITGPLSLNKEIKLFYFSYSKLENEVELEKIYSVVNPISEFIPVNSVYFENSLKVSNENLVQVERIFKNQERFPVIVLDAKNRICGYYKLDSIEEINRLLVEMSVLKQENETK